MHDVTIQDLKNIIALKDQSDELLQWILENTTYAEYEDVRPYEN